MANTLPKTETKLVGDRGDLTYRDDMDVYLLLESFRTDPSLEITQSHMATGAVYFELWRMGRLEDMYTILNLYHNLAALPDFTPFKDYTEFLDEVLVCTCTVLAEIDSNAPTFLSNFLIDVLTVKEKVCEDIPFDQDLPSRDIHDITSGAFFKLYEVYGQLCIADYAEFDNLESN